MTLYIPSSTVLFEDPHTCADIDRINLRMSELSTLQQDSSPTQRIYFDIILSLHADVSAGGERNGTPSLPPLCMASSFGRVKLEGK